MSALDDHDADMSPDWQIDDDTVEAIVRGEDLAAGQWRHLVAFACQVQKLEEAPAPAPSAELAALLDEAGRVQHSSRRRRMAVVETLAAKVAGLGLLAKVGVGASVAVTGATVAGVAAVTSGGGGDAEVAADAGADDVAAHSDVSADEGAKADVDGPAGAGADVDAGPDQVDIAAGDVADVSISGDGHVQIDLDVPVKELLQQHSLEELMAEVSLEELLEVVTPEELLGVVTVEDLLAVVPRSEVEKHLPAAELPELPEVPTSVPTTVPLPVPVPGGSTNANGSGGGGVEANLGS